MSLRTRLLLLLGSLLILLTLADWWLVRSLTGDLSQELGRVATSVSRSVVNLFVEGDDAATDGEQTPDLVVVGDEAGNSYQINFGEGSEEVESALTVTLSEDGSLVNLSRSAGPESIPVPREGIDSTLAGFSNRLLLGSVGLVGLALLAGALMVHRETRPLRKLAGAARAVGEGRLGAQAPLEGKGEVGEAVAAFNSMSTRLARFQKEALHYRERQHLAELGEIARGLAHSLRNPLNTLGLSVDRLARVRTDPVESADLAGTAREQIRRIDRTLKSLLVLTSGGDVEAEPVDLGALVRDVTLEILQDPSTGAEIDLRTPEDPVYVRGLGQELKVVLQVLLENAVEASDPGGSVEARLGPGPRIEVLDRGPGLPEEVRERLFSPHLTTKSHGAGMGLFLAHRLATRRYAGSLELTDRAGGGTKASLVLRDRVEERRD